jgi:hypothetical protein
MGVPQNQSKNLIINGKTKGLRYPDFRKPPYPFEYGKPKAIHQNFVH